MNINDKDDKAGMYIHIPFCRYKCGYCDFYSITNLDIIDVFVKNLEKEINLYKEQYPDYIFDTIYIGGGTPSVLNVKHIDKILNTLYRCFHFDKDTEITIEVNPEDITEKHLYSKSLKLLGINRISYGLQTLKKKHLIFLNRYKGIKNLKYGLELILNYFDNINVDVIHSIPEMKISELLDTLKYLIKLQIPHISAYSLMIEENTPLCLKVENKEIKPLNSNEEYKQYKFIKELLEENSYVHYEISNFAKKGYESRHNLKYWNFENYLGLGPSAHSMVNLYRWNNFRDIITYNKYLDKNKLPIENKYKLTKKNIETELIYLGLRSQGVDIKKFKLLTGKSFEHKYNKSTKLLIANGFAEYFQDKFKLTKKGFFLADEIMIKYF
ncbi:MAG: radical SAM family heme chaperone HemW [Ignavibacteria bacterium]|nr:radical SAM family heme chaperone HemW [Ignavibacteria bacterium]